MKPGALSGNSISKNLVFVHYISTLRSPSPFSQWRQKRIVAQSVLKYNELLQILGGNTFTY